MLNLEFNIFVKYDRLWIKDLSSGTVHKSQ